MVALNLFQGMVAAAAAVAVVVAIVVGREKRSKGLFMRNFQASEKEGRFSKAQEVNFPALLLSEG